MAWTAGAGSGVQTYNHYNGRGDVVAQTEAGGTLSWTGSYEAFGTRTKETGSNDDRQRANTKEEDPTGLLNEGMRYRDLETGTWLSRDPAGFVDGPNLYAYVRCNPWTSWDPHGLSGWSKAWKLYQTGGNVADALSGAANHFSEAWNSANRDDFAGTAGHVWAGLSEVLPVSVSDVEDWSSNAVAAVDATKAAASGDLSGVVDIAKEKAVEVAVDKLTGSKKHGGGSGSGSDKKNSSAGSGNQGLPETPKGRGNLEHEDNFDKAREKGFKNAGMTDPDDVEFSKVDPKTGTVVEFKGPKNAKVNYDGPHADMDPSKGHDKPHVGWQSGGKKVQAEAIGVKSPVTMPSIHNVQLTRVTRQRTQNLTRND